jgi:hypothetical protein
MSGLPESGHDWAIYEYTVEAAAKAHIDEQALGQARAEAASSPAVPIQAISLLGKPDIEPTSPNDRV